MLNMQLLHKNAWWLQSVIVSCLSFVLVSWIQIRPLGLIFLIIFSFWIYKTRSNLRVIPPPELIRLCDRMLAAMQSWRQRRPMMFCALSSTLLVSLAILGRLVSDSTVVLAALLLTVVISTKYSFKIIRIERKKDMTWSEGLSTDYELDDEFMPEVNDSNLFVLERASDLASIATITEDGVNDDDEENSDEVPSELLLPDTIPEIDDENNSTDYENDDLVPSSSSLVHLSALKDDVLSDLAEACSSQALTSKDSNIEFKRRHFKRDSSLSEDNSSKSSSASLSASSADSLSDDGLSKGLKFPDYTAVDGHHLARTADDVCSSRSNQDLQRLMGQMATESVLANTSKMLPSLVAGLFKGVLGGNSYQAPAAAVSEEEVDVASEGDNFSNGATALSTSYSPIEESVTMHLQDKRQVQQQQQGRKLETYCSLPVKQVIPGIEESSDESEFEFVQTEDFR